jgi:hypothetical protein
MPIDLTIKAPSRAVSTRAVDALEENLRSSIYRKATRGSSEERTLKMAFQQFDADGSGEISFHEFERALERFGAMAVPQDVLRALFDRYNKDQSDALSYAEFSAGLFPHVESAPPAGLDSGAMVGSDVQPIECTANPWLPSLQGSVSMDSNYARPNPARPHVRVRSIARRDEGTS